MSYICHIKPNAHKFKLPKVIKIIIYYMYISTHTLYRKLLTFILTHHFSSSHIQDLSSSLCYLLLSFHLGSTFLSSSTVSGQHLHHHLHDLHHHLHHHHTLFSLSGFHCSSSLKSNFTPSIQFEAKQISPM